MSRPRSLFSPPGFLSREESERLIQRALRTATADQTRVIVTSSSRANTRFAENQVSTSGDNYNARVAVRSAFGRRSAVATTNRLDDESLADVVRRAESLARLAPEDPEFMGEFGPQSYAAREAVIDSAPPSPADRAQAVRAVADAARTAGLISTGYTVSVIGAIAVGNSKGLFAYDSGGQTAMSTTVRTPDGTGSGWAGSTHDRWSQLDAAQLGRMAIEKGARSRHPVAIEPGRYTVILEPTAVANLVQLIFSPFGGGVSARAADEGRSFFSRPGGGNKIGLKVVDERITFVSDPADPEARSAIQPSGFGGGLSPTPFTSEGVPTQRVTWIENGVVRNLAYGRFWAQRQGVQPTFSPEILRMSGGDASVADMVQSTQRGILVTRFWYLRLVDPRTILYTGLTRDGTFLIENGRITRSVKNFRFNESPIFMLNNLETLGRPVRVNADEGGEGGTPIIVPPIKVRDFNFTSLSDAV